MYKGLQNVYLYLWSTYHCSIKLHRPLNAVTEKVSAARGPLQFVCANLRTTQITLLLAALWQIDIFFSFCYSLCRCFSAKVLRRAGNTNIISTVCVWHFAFILRMTIKQQYLLLSGKTASVCEIFMPQIVWGDVDLALSVFCEDTKLLWEIKNWGKGLVLEVWWSRFVLQYFILKNE